MDKKSRAGLSEVPPVNTCKLKDETCEEWEEQNEICDVKHSPEVV